MRVLIIEDNEVKARDLRLTVESNGVAADDIITIPDFAIAKQRMQSETFDILLLDLQIPKRWGDKTDKSGGIDLLRWAHRSTRACLPASVVAVTGYDLEQTDSGFLNSLGVPVVNYAPSRDEWRKYIAGLVKRVSRVPASQGIVRSDSVHAVILTAVDVEYKHALRVFNAQGAGERRLGVVWHRAEVVVDSESVMVMIAQSAQMGMPAAAVLTAKAIRLWSPQLLLMCGVCAGVRGAVELGDLIAPEHCWDFGSGKLTGDRLLHPDPRPVELREGMRVLLKSAAESEIIEVWHKEWPGAKVKTIPRLHIRPAASGAAVVADVQTVGSVQAHSRKIVGIDMENYGFYYAASNSGRDVGPRFCSVKAVVDFADSEKSDDFQDYGANISARLARWLVENDFGTEGDGSQP